MKTETSCGWPDAMRVWAGWTAIWCVACLESWMLRRLVQDWVQTIAQEGRIGTVPDISLAFR